MKEIMLLKFLIIAVLFVPDILPRENDDTVSVYLVKQRWHTGIVIRTTDMDTSFFQEAGLFKKFRYIDAGWGDDEFYRHPDFDLELAIKALFVNTPSTIRIEGFNFEIGKYIDLSDIGFEIKLGRDEFNKLCGFISATFEKDERGLPQIIESHYNGNITFYKARWKYNLFNTCNTWVSAAFGKAGMEIDKKVILAEQLFREIEDLPNTKRLK